MDLDAIFKAYDVRGLVPDQLDAEASRRIGAAFATFTEADRVAVGHDVRLDSPMLADAFIEGVTSTGTSVDALGPITTDMVYYAAGSLDEPGAVITASHNPKGYNGIKLSHRGAAPIGAESGLSDIKAMAAAGVSPADEPGDVRYLQILDGYVDHLMSIVDPDAFADLRVAADGGNGAAGIALPAVFHRIPVDLIGLYLDPDGNFPNHHPDPLRPENLEDLIALMDRERPDLGVAFDGDADRAFFIDDQLQPLSGSTITAMVGAWYLERRPGASIVHNLITSRAVPETIRRLGGNPVKTRVGHSYIKAVMAETGAVFGGEHSGHYYFEENFRADSGILTMLVLLQLMSEKGRPLSELRKEFELYRQSGEINMKVADQAAAMEAVSARFSDAEQETIDGLTVSWPDRWFNLRASNTEPVIRLNVEAADDATVAALVADVQEVIGADRS